MVRRSCLAGKSFVPFVDGATVGEEISVGVEFKSAMSPALVVPFAIAL